MFEILKERNKDPSVNPYLRLMDMDNSSPEIFYMMDEIGDMQILRRYDWSDTLPKYTGTFEVLHKTEVSRRFCIVMRRLANEWNVAPEHKIRSAEELKMCIVMEYYPGTQGRIFMRGLSDGMMQTVVEEYTRILQRRARRRRLVHKP